MIRILFFAQLREQLGCEALDWPLIDSATVTQISNDLIAANPQWEVFLRNDKTLCALNQSMVKFSAIVKAGDELAFFPPVTGG